MMKSFRYTEVLNKILLVVLMVLFLGSCRTNRILGDKEHAAAFQSYPNGVADINLQLAENMRFTYIMEIYPEPGGEAGDTLPEVFTFRGRWGNDQENYIIRFRRRNKPDLYALVNPGYEPSTDVVVIDERTIRFPLKNQEIVIWGVRCFKEE